MEVIGKVFEVGVTTAVSDKLNKRELILEVIDNPQYPEYLKFEMINDKCSLVDSLKPGQDVEVLFNLRGRPWTDKTGKKSYFNSLQLWKVNQLGGAGAPAPQYAPPANIDTAADSDDLPFN